MYVCSRCGTYICTYVCLGMVRMYVRTYVCVHLPFTMLFLEKFDCYYIICGYSLWRFTLKSILAGC